MTTHDGLFAEAARLEAGGEPFALCTVAETDRSAPRDGGARMLVRSDGTIAGTVGGGPLEAVVIQRALEALRGEGPATSLVEAQLTTGHDESLGMKCGGNVRVLVDACLPAARVHVFGAGHVGLKVADAARLAGFSVRVWDDRPERLAMVDGLSTARFAVDAIADVAAGVREGDWCVIVTRCHDVDEQVLKALMGTRARYVGLIGSKAKVATLFRNVRAAGLADPSQDPRVYAPIGLALGGKAPGEIAISVVAELLAVRDGAAAAHRRLPARHER